MMLTTKGRYAIMAIVDLARHCEKDKPYPLAEIAKNQEIAISYLEQIFASLRKASLVKSVRGPGGGYILANAKNDIYLSQIIDAVNEPLKMTRCGGKKPCLNGKRCQTHQLWEGLGNHIRNYFSSITIADICDEKDFNQQLKKAS